jgi:RNA polymerase sigma-70 factor (ECF subfamily)
MTATQHDRDLMLSVKRGDRASFELLHARHKCSVQRLVGRIVRDSAAAEELTQEVFLRVYQARNRYEPSASCSTWLYRIAFNRALNWLRSQGQKKATVSYDAQSYSALRRVLSDPCRNPESIMLDAEVVRRIHNAVNALPERQRTAVSLHKFEGLDYAQIAKRLHTTVPAVKSLLFRTYLSLQTRLRPEPDGPDSACYR